MKLAGPFVVSVALLVSVGCGSDATKLPPDVDAPIGGVDGSTDAPQNPTTTRLRVHYPTAGNQRITLRGDGPGLSWDAGQDCTAAGTAVWDCTVEDVMATFEAKPLVDDTTWARGPNWRLDPGITAQAYPNFFGTTGRLAMHLTVPSAHLEADRDVLVYLPPSYDENTEKSYPVIFMHDGQNLFDPNTAFGGVAWEIDAAMDHLAGTSDVEETIVVGAYNTSDRIAEYTPTMDSQFGGGQGAQYVRFLAEELRPMIDSTYRTTDGKVGIAGSSLGGLISLYACWTRPETFDRCGVFSPSLWWDDKDLMTTITADSATAATKPLQIYLDSGDSGSSMDGKVDTAMMRDILVGKGFVIDDNLRYVLGAGHAHDETAWAARAPEALRWLLPHDPHRAP